MRKYTHIFFDLDHTLWHFDANAELTLKEIYETFQLQAKGVNDFNAFYTLYLKHNERLWDRYRKGFIKQEQLRLKRMWLTLLDFKIANEPLAKEMGDYFIEHLPKRNILFPYTIELLLYLQNKNYNLHIITNGFDDVQLKKMNNSGIRGFFREIITSENANSLKPQKEIFEYALKKTGAAVSNSLMIGDSLEADIEGAINAGIDQIFVNHPQKEHNISPTYTVTSLQEIESIL